MSPSLRFGLVLNPVAGVGGPAGLKGSDGAGIQELALQRGYSPRAAARAGSALAAFSKASEVHWHCAGGVMGEDALRARGVEPDVVYRPSVSAGTTATDTRSAATALERAGCDLIVFVGGDGTARDMHAALGDRVPVLGVPAGVKMHSAVFAVSPEAAGQLLELLVSGGLVAAVRADVRDIDEAKLRAGEIGNRFYGEMSVPDFAGYLQQTKIGGRENEALAVEEIVADIEQRYADEAGLLVLAPGSTVYRIKQALGINEPTLLGVDVLLDGRSLLLDANSQQIDGAVNDAGGAILIVSFTRGQGFLFGRGNQQLSAGLLKGLPRENLVVVGTRSKLATLSGRPLLVDTGDANVDQELAGLIEVTAGFEDRLYYQVVTGFQARESETPDE